MASNDVLIDLRMKIDNLKTRAREAKKVAADLNTDFKQKLNFTVPTRSLIGATAAMAGLAALSAGIFLTWKGIRTTINFVRNGIKSVIAESKLFDKQSGIAQAAKELKQAFVPLVNVFAPVIERTLNSIINVSNKIVDFLLPRIESAMDRIGSIIRDNAKTIVSTFVTLEVIMRSNVRLAKAFVDTLLGAKFELPRFTDEEVKKIVNRYASIFKDIFNSPLRDRLPDKETRKATTTTVAGSRISLVGLAQAIDAGSIQDTAKENLVFMKKLVDVAGNQIIWLKQISEKQGKTIEEIKNITIPAPLQ